MTKITVWATGKAIKLIPYLTMTGLMKLISCKGISSIGETNCLFHWKFIHSYSIYIAPLQESCSIQKHHQHQHMCNKSSLKVRKKRLLVTY